MKRYLPQITCVLCLLLGLSIGWYFGYTRPAVHMQHLHDEVQSITSMSEREMVRAVPETLAAIKREDESVALVSLRAVGMLDREAKEAAKNYLVYWVGMYYQAYRTNGDTNLLASIEAAAVTNRQLAVALTNLPLARAAIKEAAMK